MGCRHLRALSGGNLHKHVADAARSTGEHDSARGERTCDTSEAQSRQARKPDFARRRGVSFATLLHKLLDEHTVERPSKDITIRKAARP